MQERMREKSEKNTGRNSSGRIVLTGHLTHYTWDEVTLAEEPGARTPPGGPFIFLFRVHWWFHKNSWRNINRVLTHFCLKVFPLALGWLLLYTFTRL